MGGLKATAHLSLRATGDAGLEAPLPSGTKSLLLAFESGMNRPPKITLGTMIVPVTVDALAPGAGELEVWWTFWADEAEVFVAQVLSSSCTTAGQWAPEE